MKVIHNFIDANSLMSVMNLPEAFRNQKLEVIIFPADEQISEELAKDIQNIIQSLVGSIPHEDLSLNELRDERLKNMKLLIDTGKC